MIQQCTDVYRALFAPQIQRKERNFVSHLESYLGSTEGLRSGFELLARSFEVLNVWQTSATPLGQLATRAQRVFDDVAASCDLSDCLTKPPLFCRQVLTLTRAKSVLSLGALRFAKDATLNAACCVKAVAGAALFSHRASIVKLAASQVARLSSAVNLTMLISDCSDLMRDGIVLARPMQSEERCVLAFLNVVKNTASVGIGVLMLTASLANAYILSLGLICVVAKISAHFYDKMVVEPMSPFRFFIP